MGTKVYSAALGPSLREIRDQVRDFEAIGVDGVFTTDHIFVSRGRARREAARGSEPFIRLAVVGALSERLVMGTAVVNISLLHPALALRQFVELANLYGGSRVLAGIGGGWNPEEFDSLGMTFDPLPKRMARLEQAARLFRSVFDTGIGDASGEYVVTRDLPMGPVLSPPPRLLLGGGSDYLLEIAGRYADVVDLNGSSRRAKLSGAHPVFTDAIRRLTTTVDDLEMAAARVRETASAAGRDPNRIEFSILVSQIRFCAESEIAAQEADICRSAGIDPRPLHSCPYFFIGPVERMRAQLAERVERMGLRHLIVGATGVTGIEQMARFRQEVVAQA